MIGCRTDLPPESHPAAVATYVQAVLQYKSGDTDKAIATLKDAISQHSNVTMAHGMLGDLYQQKKEFAAALEQYQITSSLDPYGGGNYYKQGLMLQMLGRVQDAIAAYLRALKLNPQDFGSTLNLAAAYLSLNQPTDALPYARRATELNAKSALAWCDLAVSLDMLKRYADAEYPYQKALELDTRPDIAIGLADNYVHQRKLKDAHSVMGQVLQTQSTSQNHKKMADINFLLKDYDQAIEEYKAALKFDAQFYPALNEIGWVLIAQYQQSLGLDDPKREAALDMWRKSLAINPQQPRIAQLMQAYAQKYSDGR